MLFNSIEFFIFFPAVYILYWFFLKHNLKLQNALLLISSYVFYGWWDYRFLSLIVLSTLVDYFVGQKVYNTSNKKLWLAVSVVFNLGLLAFFKYYNFFVESMVTAINELGLNIDPWTLNIILPVGISFYTFQTMSYTLDIYKGQLKPTKDLIGFGAFVAFFPQLVAGPIERASNLLPQILNGRKFSYRQSVEGLKLLLWGMFKKVVIADSLAPIVNDVFSNYTAYNGGVIALAVVYFGIQIYCDFSGYSDIARGLAKLMGIELMLNFNFPYFSRSIGEFWRKWHISLSTWFRDYLYIPLGGSKVSKSKVIRNILLVFLISGFWHGANWTFICWGGIHAVMCIPAYFFINQKHKKKTAIFSSNITASLINIAKVLFIFLVVSFAWIFFRAESMSHAFELIHRITNQLAVPDQYRMHLFRFVLPLILLEALSHSNTIVSFFNKKQYMRYATYYVLLFSILTSFGKSVQDFIYFQF